MGRSVLAGDIGGTKTTLALYSTDEIRVPVRAESYDSRTAQNAESLVARFLEGEAEPPPAFACLAVAGPVFGQSVEVTNLPWKFSASALASRFGFEGVRLLNDVEALAHVVPALREGEVQILQNGDADPEGVVGILALGTGLGEAFLTRHHGAICSYAAEGGHADFAPTTPQQIRLLQHLWREDPHVSVERVCSGIGLPNLHRFLIGEEGMADDPSVAAEIAGAADPTPAIVQAALSGRSAPCREAVELLCDILAAEAGNLALKVLATGGIYLGGGLPPRLLTFLQTSRFRTAFSAKGRLSPLLERVPVAVILAPQGVLWGAAHCAMSLREGE